MSVVRLIRHGQASFGLGDYDKLTDLGVLQAELLGRSLKRRVGTVRAVVCGEMRRHRQTAEAALATSGIDAELIVDPRWNEYDHEELVVRRRPAYRSKAVMAADLTRRGDPHRQFDKMFQEALRRWTGGEHDDYSESWPQFTARTNAALETITEQYGGDGDVLVFTSGGPTSAVTAELLGLGAEGWLRLNNSCANCSETKVVAGRRGLTLVTWNAHPWFDHDRELLSYR